MRRWGKGILFFDEFPDLAVYDGGACIRYFLISWVLGCRQMPTIWIPAEVAEMDQIGL